MQWTRPLDLIQRTLGFTRNEAVVVVVLVGAFLLGTGVKWYARTGSGLPAAVRGFDYGPMDKEFHERSSRIGELGQATSQVQQGPLRATKPPLQPHSININTATKEQLVLLPGIGEAYADRIILHREDFGPFRTVDDLVNVKGIGKKTLERLRPYITVR